MVFIQIEVQQPELESNDEYEQRNDRKMTKKLDRGRKVVRVKASSPGQAVNEAEHESRRSPRRSRYQWDFRHIWEEASV